MPLKRGKGRLQGSHSGRRLAVERLEDRTMLSASAVFPALLTAHGLVGNYGPSAYGVSAPATSGRAPATSPSAAALSAAESAVIVMEDTGSGGTTISGGIMQTGGASLQDEGVCTGETGGTFVTGGTLIASNSESLAAVSGGAGGGIGGLLSPAGQRRPNAIVVRGRRGAGRLRLVEHLPRRGRAGGRHAGSHGRRRAGAAARFLRHAAPRRHGEVIAAAQGRK
jgi:hypothetical protein